MVKKDKRLIKYKRVATKTRPIKVKFRRKDGTFVSFKAKKVVRKKK